MCPPDTGAAPSAPKPEFSKPDAGDIDRMCIDTIRTLSMDAVQMANSGHPGTPMGMAPVAYTLWQRFLRYDPANPDWPNRDRFVLSAGHASMLLYSLLHLTGVQRLDRHGKKLNVPAVSLEDIKQFRQLDSVCPGHPEYRITTGVETTTGPLGQGCANSVGLAMAERWTAATVDWPDAKADEKLIDYNVYVICGDGDMMEGVSAEAASVAGHLKLSNLCWIYDSNTISIEGHTDLAFDENVAERFAGYGWNVIDVADANDCEAVAYAIEGFHKTPDRPTLIIVHSLIGYGSPKKQNTAAAHGEPLGVDEIKAAKRFYGWPEESSFLVPDGVRAHFDEGIGARGAQLHADWLKLYQRYGETEPKKAAQFQRMLDGGLPEDWDADIPVFPADAKGVASRESGGKVLNAIAGRVPWLLGGAADLSPSTKTNLTFEGAGSFQKDNYAGRNMHYGVREHAMGAITNGLNLSHLRAYSGTFFVFTDYMKPPVRLAAIMELNSIFVFTHDSIGVGEDGPTHQPIEQLAMLRAVPGLIVLRPGDANETAEAWRVIMQQTERPTCLVLTRQNLPTLDREKYASAKGVARGAYILADAEGGDPQVILMASGSEVSLCVDTYEKLKAEGVKTRVVSMPSWDLFECQDQAYRDSVLPPGVTARVAVEQAAALGWDRYAGPTGEIIAMRGFGASAPYSDLKTRFGFTPEHVYEAAKKQMSKGPAR
jgi:transketolase